MAHAGGRPTDYDPKYCQSVDEYLKTTGKEQMHLPKIVSFSRYIGVAKSTIYEWKDKYPEFSDALAKIMDAQEEELIDDGVFGGKEINATIVKLLLQNNHGMKDQSQEDVKQDINVNINDYGSQHHPATKAKK